MDIDPPKRDVEIVQFNSVTAYSTHWTSCGADTIASRHSDLERSIQFGNALRRWISNAHRWARVALLSKAAVERAKLSRSGPPKSKRRSSRQPQFPRDTWTSTC